MFGIALAFVLITVIGLLGNVLVLVVIALNAQMHDSTSLFICNLAMADLFFLAFCVPMTALSYISNSWPFPDSLCYVTVSLQYVTCYVSVWTLVLLAHDRFLSITSATSGRSLRRCRAVFCICSAVWTLVLALNSLQMRHVGVLRFEYNGTYGSACVDSLEIALATASPTQARLFYWGFNLGAYLLPLALSCAFYFLLVKEIWRQKLVQSKSSQKMKRHATRIVFVVIITFGLCWFPQNLRFFLQGLNYPEASFWERDEKTLLLVQSVVQTMSYANSCVNPILYGLLSERFRLAFQRTISRLFCKNSFGGPAGHFPASFGNLSTQQRNSSPYFPSKRPSSQLTLGCGSRLDQSNMMAATGGWTSPGDGLNSRSSLSLGPPSDESGRRQSSPSASSVQLLPTWARTRLATLGEESRTGLDEGSDEGEDDIVLL